MLLRYLKEVTLKKATKVKQLNGSYKNIYNDIDTYKVQTQDLTDDVVSATIYGANINKILRLSSPLNKLEQYLLPKVDNKQDNISSYYIEFNNKLYKINSVAIDKIDIELVNSTPENISY
ncbi:hypothetical protein IKS57_01935 [bacterium]|nr:hypothetical protein [bacterium]